MPASRQEVEHARKPAPVGEGMITVCPHVNETLESVFERLAAQLAMRDAGVLAMMIFGRIAAHDEIARAMLRVLGETSWPVTWIEGGSCDGSSLAGVQVWALAGRPIARVRLGQRVVGSVYEDGEARHILLGGLGPTSVALQPAAQVQQTFGNIAFALETAGFDFGDLVRTWFYNEDILAWYGDFNRVRSAHYANVKFRSGAMPASTGISARNPLGAALTVAARAVRPIEPSTGIRAVGSPLQCPAPAYGSAFSRAMEIESGGWRRLYVSGTASIGPEGQTAWVGRAKQQVNLTMDVVGAILGSRGMEFRDVTRATAYFKDPLFKSYFESWCARHELHSLPVVSTHCGICREDLLFELEVDATVPTRDGRA